MLHLTHLIEGSDGDDFLHVRRGDAHAELGEWDNAVANFDRAHTLNPVVWNLHDLGLAQLGRGDTASYRRTCQQLLDRFGGTEDSDTAYALAILSVLLPDAVADHGALVGLAEKADDKELLGMVLYRNGQFNEAEVALTPGSQSEGEKEKGSIMASLFLAMARHKLKSVESAQLTFAEAVERIKSLMQRESDDEKSKPPSWHSRLRLELLRQETETMVTQP